MPRELLDLDVEEISSVDMPANMRKFLVIKRAEVEVENIQLAAWTTAYVDSLPDSSFAWIEPGGQKEDGKTSPRSKRHLPFKDKSGTPDKEHVQNALARLNQTDIPAAAKASAKRKLLAAAKQLGMETSEETQKDAMGVPHREPDGDETPPMDYATRQQQQALWQQLYDKWHRFCDVFYDVVGDANEDTVSSLPILATSIEQFRADVDALLDQVGLAKADVALEALAALATTETPSAAHQAQLHATFAAVQALLQPQDDPPTKGARMADKDVSEVQKQELEALRKRADEAEARATALHADLETTKA